jgi:hypothetical protein
MLLALLFITDAVLPTLPVEDRANTELPVIRIHSDRKWPERVVFDTSKPMVAPAQTQTATDAAAPAPAPPAVADVSGEGRRGDAFAQLQPSDAKQKQVQSTDRKRADAKPQQHKRKIARSRVGPPRMLVAQQPRFGFGWFDNGPWHSTW